MTHRGMLENARGHENARVKSWEAKEGSECSFGIFLQAGGQASPDDRSPDERRRSMSWEQRLKRVFNIDVTTCTHCGGSVRIIASIEEPHAIRGILGHFEKHGVREQAHYRPAARAPPAAAA